MHKPTIELKLTMGRGFDEEGLVQSLSVPRPGKLSKSGTMAAATALFKPVRQELYDFGDVAMVAQAMASTEDVSTPAMHELFKACHWAEAVFVTEHAVEFAMADALENMEAEWAYSVMIKPNRRVGDAVVVNIGEEAHAGIIQRIDEELGRYGVQTLAPVKGFEVVGEWLVPFESLDGLPSKATLDQVRKTLLSFLGESEMSPGVEAETSETCH